MRPLGNPIKSLEKLLPLSPMFPPKHFDNFPPPDWVDAQKVRFRCDQAFLKHCFRDHLPYLQWVLFRCSEFFAISRHSFSIMSSTSLFSFRGYYCSDRASSRRTFYGFARAGGFFWKAPGSSTGSASEHDRVLWKYFLPLMGRQNWMR